MTKDKAKPTKKRSIKAPKLKPILPEDLVRIRGGAPPPTGPSRART